MALNDDASDGNDNGWANKIEEEVMEHGKGRVDEGARGCWKKEEVEKEAMGK
jgi:hypothetical protein